MKALAYALLTLIVVITVGVNAARAHSFYDFACCSDKDCAPAQEGTVTWTPAGWSVVTPAIHTVVPFDSDRIRYNPHGVPQIHICEYPKNNLRCLYLPEPEG